MFTKKNKGRPVRREVTIIDRSFRTSKYHHHPRRLFLSTSHSTILCSTVFVVGVAYTALLYFVPYIFFWKASGRTCNNTSVRFLSKMLEMKKSYFKTTTTTTIKGSRSSFHPHVRISPWVVISSAVVTCIIVFIHHLRGSS